MSRTRLQAVKAFIHQDDKVLLQLRDQKPGIWHPGMWGLFGGTVEQGENLTAALHRELYEELNLEFTNAEFLYSWEDDTDYSILHFYSLNLDVELSSLKLFEGQSMALVSIVQLREMELTPDLWNNLSRLINLVGTLK